MKRFLLSILMVVIGLSAFSQSPSKSISLRPAYPLVIGESTVGNVVLSNNWPYTDDTLQDTLPIYEIGEIFEQTVRYSEAGYGFYIKADSLHSANVVYSYEVSGQPLGSIRFNESTGLFIYYPTPDEYWPFAVIFSATNGTETISDEVEFYPMPKAYSEENAFNTQGTMPDAGDYTIVAETSKTMYLNNAERTAYSISISGKNVVFDNAVQNKVWGLNGREDIYELNIYAERLIIRSALSFPQTNITVYAKELIFEDRNGAIASINTTPSAVETLTDGVGINGANAGDITLNVKDFKGNQGIRLILNGAKGQSVNRNGTPGNGGNGGTVFSTVDINSFCDFVRGNGGVKYDVAGNGSIDAGPVIGYGDIGDNGHFEMVNRPYAYLHPYYVSAVMRHADDAFINNYNDEVYQICQEYRTVINEYLHPGSENALDNEGGVHEGIIDIDNLNKNESILDLLIDDEEDVERKMGLQNILVEIDKLLFKLEQGLDYFGNPVGWTPLLSFEVMRSNYENEINRAIKTLYLYYWLNDKDRTLQEKVEACQVAANNTEQEIDNNQELLNSLVLEIPVLQDEAENIANQIDVLTRKIEAVQQELMAKAIKTVKKRNRWKKLFGIASSVASVLPAFGPIGGAIGATISVVGSVASTGLNAATGIDYSSALSGIQDIEDVSSDWSKITSNTTNVIEWQKSYANIMNKAINPMVKGINNAINILSKSSAPNSEVQAEYNKLLACSSVYRDLKNQVEELNLKKEELVAHVNQVFSDITSTVSDLSNDALALDAFRRDVFIGNSKRDLNAMLYLEKMEQRSKNRLLLYDYYMRKAYEYRMLKPYTGEFNLVGMFERIEEFASIGESVVISNDNYQTLATVFEERISDITQAIVSDFTMERTSEVSYKLSKEQINALNSGEDITLNFYEDINTLRNKDNVRILDIDIFNLGKHVEGTLTSSGTMELRFAHSGISKFRKDGEIFWFNHKTKNSSNPHKWIMSYDVITGSMTSHKPSAASQSLLSSLVGSNQIMYFSRPSAWSDMTLSKIVDTDFADIVIDSLTVKITYDYTDRKDGLYYIDIATNEELTPYISCTDNHGQSGGYGNLYKSYSTSVPVTFTAVNKYGSFRFKNWTDRAGNIASNSTSLTVNKQRDQFYIANYEYLGPLLSVPDTIRVSNAGGSYTISVRNVGHSDEEMEWYVVDSLATFVHIEGEKEGVDDGTITFTFDPNPTGEVRVDTLEILAPDSYITMKNIYIIQTDEVVYNHVDVTDIANLSNAIYIEPVNVAKGSQPTLSVKMKNDAPIQTIQFDLYLPEGVTVVADEDGELITPSKERIKKYNYFESTMHANGAIRLLAQATTTNVPAGDGEICRLVVDVPESMEEGEYPIVFKDALMVESDNSNHSPDPNLVQCKLTVMAYTPGDANNDGGINAIDFNMIGNYILGNHGQANFNEKAADISGDGNVNAIDFNMVGNIILYGTTTPSKARSRGSMVVPQ